MKSSCPEIEIEDGPYPTDEWIEKLEQWKPESFHDARFFFIYDLPDIFNHHLHPFGYAKCVEDKDGRHHLYMATGGWSGCEAIIVVLNTFSVERIGFYSWIWNTMTVRGGAYWWVIPGIKND